MKQILKRKLKSTKRAIINYPARKRLKNKKFTIITDNCWGGFIYQDLDVEYRTPFIGLFIFADDYIKMLKDLEYYLSQPLSFTRESKFKDMTNFDYPLGLLGDVELHFLHYKDEKEAKTKWNRRSQRINLDNLFIKMFDGNGCSEEVIREFDELNFENKIIFTAKEYKELKSSIWFHECQNEQNVGDDIKAYKRYFDVVHWLNDEVLVRK